MHLVTIQGLITNKKNKNEFLKLVTSSQNSTSNRIIAVTETHLNPQHFNAEITKYFTDYNVIKADRDTNYDMNDDYQLQSCGGCLLLTSQDIITIPKITFSNGNCELVIANCPEIKLDISCLSTSKNKFFTDKIQRSYQENSILFRDQRKRPQYYNDGRF